MFLFKILLFSLFISIFLLNGCSEKPLTPSQAPVKPKVSVTPQQARLQQAQAYKQQALQQKPPQRNETLLQGIQFLFTPDKAQGFPSTRDYRWIASLLSLIDQTVLTADQQNRFVLYQAQYQLYQKSYQQMLQLLSAPLQQPTDQQQQHYFYLQAQAYRALKKPLKALQALIHAYTFAHESQQKRQIVTALWDNSASLSISVLQNEITQLAQASSQPLTTQQLWVNQQLSGWLDLQLLIKSKHSQYQIMRALPLWRQNHETHMASDDFIRAQLKKRFQLLLHPRQIALLLPLQGKLQKVAHSILNGIMAAYFQQSVDDQQLIRVYNSQVSDEEIKQVYLQAVEDGAQVVLGPFRKSAIRTLLQYPQILSVPTLFLNTLEQINTDNSDMVVDNAFFFALNPADEIRALTDFAFTRRKKNALILSPQSHWGDKMEKLFRAYWQTHGIILNTQKYTRKEFDFSKPLQQMLGLDLSEQRKRRIQQTIGRSVVFTPRRRQDIDVVFLAAFPKQARQIPLQIRYHYGSGIPVLATASIMANTQDSKALKDLEGIYYSDIPYLIKTKKYPYLLHNDPYKRSLYQRLFSFGRDSYRLIPLLQLLAQNSEEQLDGATGKLTMQSHQIIRHLPVAQIKNGVITRVPGEQEPNEHD